LRASSICTGMQPYMDSLSANTFIRLEPRNSAINAFRQG
jgi:hypothetical protein